MCLSLTHILYICMCSLMKLKRYSSNHKVKNKHNIKLFIHSPKAWR